jgi:hypothetical protein
MKNAYGINRDPEEFAHVDYDEGRLFIDHGETREQLDALVNRGGAREGDTLSVLSVGDLGRGVAAKNTKELIEGKGITVAICPAQVPHKPAGRRGPRGFQPSDVLDGQLREMWANPIRYTQPYVVTYASKEYGSPVSRNQLNHKYGNRFEKEGQADE